QRELAETLSALVFSCDLLEPLNKCVVRFDGQIYLSLRRARSTHRLQQQSADFRHGLGIAWVDRIVSFSCFSKPKDLSYSELSCYDVCCISLLLGHPRG